MRSESPPKTVAAELRRKAERAEALAGEDRAPRLILRFIGALIRAQAEIAERLDPSVLSGSLSHDLDPLLDAARPLIELAAREGPAALRTRAESLLALPPGSPKLLLKTPEAGYLGRAVLRPYLEVLRALGIPAPRGLPGAAGSSIPCPYCQGGPHLAIRRASPESDGALRFLQCALCGGEWPVGRIRCPGCGEEDPAKLPHFTDEARPNVRLEACDRCRSYLKSIDLSVAERVRRSGPAPARPIPEIEDLLSISLDLWGLSAGYRRLEYGRAGDLATSVAEE